MYERIVVKFGTGVLTGSTPNLDHPTMVELVRQLATLHRAGKQVSVCTSAQLQWGGSSMIFRNCPTPSATSRCWRRWAKPPDAGVGAVF